MRHKAAILCCMSVGRRYRATVQVLSQQLAFVAEMSDGRWTCGHELAVEWPVCLPACLPVCLFACVACMHVCVDVWTDERTSETAYVNGAKQGTTSCIVLPQVA